MTVRRQLKRRDDRRADWQKVKTMSRSPSLRAPRAAGSGSGAAPSVVDRNQKSTVGARTGLRPLERDRDKIILFSHL